MALPEGGPTKALLSYQNARTITGKPHLFPEERNQVLLRIACGDKSVKMEYLGMSYDIKGTNQKGHYEGDLWHYYKIKMAEHDGFLSIREHDKRYSFHSIQDEKHFRIDKIMFPYENE